jgi:hypothetical protein
MTKIESGYRGIDAEISTTGLRLHPDLNHPPGQDGRYIAMQESPYELRMFCDLPYGADCVAYVESKKFHFRYRMRFPSEAAEHTDDIIMSIEKLLQIWSEK